MTLENSSLPSPVINKQGPNKNPRPTKIAWLSTFTRLLKVPNTRYALFWITGGLFFTLFVKQAVKKREKELMIEDVENYLENKRKKSLE